MIKAAMRFGKNQLPSQFVLTTSGTFLRDKFLMAGFTNYQLMVVGAAGGRSGYHRENNSTAPLSTISRAYSSAGGGGGSLLVSGLLLDLPANTSYQVGVIGTTGADGLGISNSSGAGNGGPGGNSFFGPWAASGGEGGLGGGYFDGNYKTVHGGRGGIGGALSTYAGGIGGASGATVYDPPTNGTFIDDGSGVMIGGGGGGGVGAWYKSETVVRDREPQNGANGAATDPTYMGVGSDAGDAKAAYRGGQGAGANVAMLINGNLESRFYGGGKTVRPFDTVSSNGVIVLKLS